MQEENRCRETLCTSPASVLCLVASLFACDSGLLVPGSRTAVTPTQACEADREETRPRQGVSRCSSLPQAAFLHSPSLENNVACSFPPGSEAWPAGALARPRAAPGTAPASASAALRASQLFPDPRNHVPASYFFSPLETYKAVSAFLATPCRIQNPLLEK